MSETLVAVKIGSKKHLKFIRAGYRTHHTSEGIAWLEKPNIVKAKR